MRKVDVEALVNRQLPKLIKVLNLQDKDIHVDVLHSKCKETSENGPEIDTFAYVDDLETSSPSIVMHYDMFTSPTSAYSTLVHELLHIKLSVLAPKKETLAYTNKEEQVVRDIEALILSLVRRKKL